MELGQHARFIESPGDILDVLVVRDGAEEELHFRSIG
jgi:hypothetical protein